MRIFAFLRTGQSPDRLRLIFRWALIPCIAALVWVASTSGSRVSGDGVLPALFNHAQPPTAAAVQQEPEVEAQFDDAGADFADGLDDATTSGDATALAAPNPNFGGNLATLGVAAGSFSAAPTMSGDLFGAGVSQLIVDDDDESPGFGGDEPLIIAGPDVATRRVKLSENFSPVVRDRCYVNYSFFNDAFGGLGDVSRWVLGYERSVLDDLISIEVRQPMAATYGSTQQIDDPGDRSYELGNMTIVSKFVLWRQQDLIWSAGLGATIPLADDAKIMNDEETLLRIRNQSVHLLPYTGLLLRTNPDTAFQGFIQFDVDANGNDIRGDLDGGPLPKLGTFNDSALVALDASVHQTLYRQYRRSRGLQEVIGNAELHYTGTLQESDVVTGEGITINNLARNFNVLNATLSSHFLFGERLVVTPGISLPLRDGNDEQFDYEAMLQVNYFR